MSKPKLVLFVATLSRMCQKSIKYIIENKIDIDIVKLDTPETRNLALNGKYFQIKMVPTMIVNYDDGNMEVFIGNDKIIPVLTTFLHPTSSTYTQNNMYSSLGGSVTPSKPIYAPRANYAKDPVHVVEYESEEEKQIYVEEEDIDDYDGGNTTPEIKNKKRPPVSFDDEDEEIDVEYIDEREIEMQKQKPGKPSRMQELIDTAKNLENQRLSSLGYNESDLPHYQ